MLLESRAWMMQVIDELRKERNELRAEAAALRPRLGSAPDTCPAPDENGNER
jgi:hypothetical protein